MKLWFATVQYYQTNFEWHFCYKFSTICTEHNMSFFYTSWLAILWVLFWFSMNRYHKVFSISRMQHPPAFSIRSPRVIAMLSFSFWCREFHLDLTWIRCAVKLDLGFSQNNEIISCTFIFPYTVSTYRKDVSSSYF